jgi:ribonuclease-3
MIFNLFRKPSKFEAYIESLIKTKTKNHSYYRLALTHSSLGHKNSNERLEFLGDSIIGSVVSAYLYQNLPNEREGSLTNTKCKIVSRENLNRVGLSINLDRWILHKPNVPISENYIGNAFEPLVGAVYLDKGYLFCESFILRMLSIDIKEIEDQVVSYKTIVIETCQKWKMEYQYKVVDVGSPKDPKFEASLYVEGALVSTGIASSKKKAEELCSQKYTEVININH